jgi:hypothetical protein
MQVTIDLPERLAREVERDREHAAEIFELGLRQRCVRASGLRREVLSFLARGPSAEQIANFQPCEQTTARIRQLLSRGKDRSLTSAEEAEMEDIAEVDQMFSQLKAEAFVNLRAPS